MKSTTHFGDMVKDLTGVGGFPARDLLPLIPPGAALSDNSKIEPHQIGKIPGRFFAGKWSGLSGTWPTFGMTERDQTAAMHWPTNNVGLRSADFPGIDCDTSTEEALHMVERIVSAQFGEGLPTRTRGNAPRALFVFRRDGDEQIRKHRIEFTDTEGKAHAVEVLGLGQQYVVSGIHTTGVAYEWREQRGENGAQFQGDLLAYRATGLTKVTLEDIVRFMSSLQSEILSRGWAVTKAYAPKYGVGGRSDGVLVSKAEPLIDPKLALEALQAIPNTAETLPTREELVALLSSFKQAVGNKADEMLPEVIEWGSAHGWADDHYIMKIWDSLTTARVSPDHLMQAARRYGWRGDAVLDFKEFGEDEGGQKEMTVDEKIERAMTETEGRARALSDIAKKLVYWTEEQTFIKLDTGECLSAEALNSSPGFGTKIAPAGTSGVKSTANRLRTADGLLREVKGIVYLPGKPPLTNWEKEGRKGLFYNRWHAHALALPDKVTDADVQPWLDHAAYLVPDDKERGLLFDFFAHVVQRRGEKVRWAPMIIGKQGTGKDLLLKPLMMFFGHNAQDIRPEQLSARFNSFLENELLVVQEMKKHAKTSVLYNQIKTILSGTASDTNMVEKKFQSPYAVPNTVNSVFFSNHMDAIEIDDDDRRFFIIISDAEKKDFQYYQALAEDFYKAQSGWRKVIRWLMNRPLTTFDPSRPPNDSTGKQMVIEAQRGVLYKAIGALLAQGEFKARTAVSANELFDRLKTDFNVPGMDNQTRNDLKNTATITNELSHMGWRTVRSPIRVKTPDNTETQVRVWLRPNTEENTKAIRSELEANLFVVSE